MNKRADYHIPPTLTRARDNNNNTGHKVVHVGAWSIANEIFNQNDIVKISSRVPSFSESYIIHVHVFVTIMAITKQRYSAKKK